MVPTQEELEAVLDYVHSDLQQVPDVTYLSHEQNQWTKRITALYKWVAHGLVLGDAIAGDINSWDPVRLPLAICRHCDICREQTLAGLVAIVADDTYRLSPGLTRDRFAEEYQRIHNLDFFTTAPPDESSESSKN